MQNFEGTSSGGSPTSQRGMESASFTMRTGPAPQMWSCSQMPATEASAVISRANGARVPSHRRVLETNR